MTMIINLFGGSGIGKSTAAAKLYSELKGLDINAELVREYVKHWAWNNRQVGEYDQLYLLGKQSQAEAQLYGKVDVIVTDSPVLLAGIYAKFRWDGVADYVDLAARSFIDHATKNGMGHVNFVLSRTKPFDPRGRYESEEQSREIDSFIRQYLQKNSLNYLEVPAGEDPSDFILGFLRLCALTVKKPG
jgi:nicotinamide riboside kinase